MTGTQLSPSGSGHVEVALAAGLSAAFVGLAIVATPLVATAVVLPASLAAGRWRAHRLPRRSPHSLSVPVYSSDAVIHAPRVSASPVHDTGVTTAA